MWKELIRKPSWMFIAMNWEKISWDRAAIVLKPHSRKIGELNDKQHKKIK